MTWTYGGNPAASDLAAVRYLIGDTDSTNPLQSDEELNWLISQQASVYDAAAAGSAALAAKFARQVSKTVGAMKLEAQQKYEHYHDLAADLRAQAGNLTSSLPMPSAPGLSIQTKRDRDADSDLVQPFFRRGDSPAVEPLVDVR